MPVCNGAGDKGDHCCYIGGQVCEFLFINRAGTPRCGVWDEMDSDKWRNSPAGRFMDEHYPGFDCRDYPQNIPGVMERGIDLCCWGN